MNLAQVDPTPIDPTTLDQSAADALPVVTPEVAWSGLTPILVLAGGAILLVMLRSILKRMPADVERVLIVAVGPATVLGAWFAAGLAGGTVPFEGIRDDSPAGFWIGFGVCLLVGAGLMHLLRMGFDASFTFGLGLVTMASAWGLWTGRLDTDGAFNAIGDQFGVDGFSVVFAGIIAMAVAFGALLLDDYLRRERIDGPEMYVLMLLSATGGVVMAGANDLIVLFLGLETLSIAVYVMAAMHVRRTESIEAGLKYFVLGAFSSAFLLYGIALAYGATGSTNLIDIRAYLDSVTLTDDGLLLAGFALLLVGLGFKVAAVPFHEWTPDVYQGAPTPVVAFMASAVKAAAFAALIRVFVTTFGSYGDDWQPVVYVLAVLTLLVGAVLAVVQSDVKRMLAYSSISHAGFILVGVQVANDQGTAAVVFYAAVYAVLVIGSFGVLTLITGRDDRATNLEDLDGLSSRRPGLAFAFTVFLLAQAGVPFTAGFVAKFEVIAAAVDGHSYWLAIIAMVAAVISAFLYLRIVLAMYLGSGGDEPREIDVPRAAGFALTVALVLTIGFGLFPGPLDELSREAIPRLVAAVG